MVKVLVVCGADAPKHLVNSGRTVKFHISGQSGGARHVGNRDVSPDEVSDIASSVKKAARGRCVIGSQLIVPTPEMSLRSQPQLVRLRKP